MKITINPKSRLINATKMLAAIGIDLNAKSVAREVTSNRVKELEVLGREEAQAILEVLASVDAFDDVVREQVKEMRVAERYELVRNNFKTILDDAETQVNQVTEDGKLSVWNKIQNRFVEFRRGTIQARFQELRNTCEQVFSDVGDQIKREMTILEAYAEFRVALKEGGMVAEGLRRKAEERKNNYAQALGDAQSKVDEAREAGADVLAVGHLELARDQARRDFEVEDRRFQTSLDMQEQLMIAYATAEAIMTKMAQTTQVKDAQHRKSTTFYTANSGTLTALTMAFTSIKGLHESTATQNAMQEGMNEALRRLPGLGTEVQTRALQAAYGSTVDVQALRALFESAAEWAAKESDMITDLRKTSSENNNQVKKVIEEGQRKMAEVLARRGTNRAEDVAVTSQISLSIPASEPAAEVEAPKAQRASAPKP